jgi:hypothetical protein
MVWLLKQSWHRTECSKRPQSSQCSHNLNNEKNNVHDSRGSQLSQCSQWWSNQDVHKEIDTEVTISEKKTQHMLITKSPQDGYKDTASQFKCAWRHANRTTTTFTIITQSSQSKQQCSWFTRFTIIAMVPMIQRPWWPQSWKDDNGSKHAQWGNQEILRVRIEHQWTPGRKQKSNKVMPTSECNRWIDSSSSLTTNRNVLPTTIFTKFKTWKETISHVHNGDQPW